MPASPELKQQIEDLAFSVVMAHPGSDGTAPDWSQAILKIRERAVAEQSLAIANVAGSFDYEALDPQAAVTRLQQAVEAESGAQVEPYDLAQDPELLRDFVIESRDNLLAIETQTLKLERQPSDREALNAAFRSF